MPLPVRICAHLADPFLADLCGKQRTKPVPPETDRFMADVDAAFVQKILHVPKRKRKLDVRHHRQADHLRAGFGVAKWAAFWHPPKLRGCPARLNQFCSDSVAKSAEWLIFTRLSGPFSDCIASLAKDTKEPCRPCPCYMLELSLTER